MSRTIVVSASLNDITYINVDSYDTLCGKMLVIRYKKNSSYEILTNNIHHLIYQVRPCLEFVETFGIIYEHIFVTDISAGSRKTRKNTEFGKKKQEQKIWIQLVTF